jgi:hypothetical protein
MEMIVVRSTAIYSVGYDPQTMRMRIVFSDRDAYDFCGVPQHVYEGLLTAHSKGQFYNAYIRDRYQC